MLCRICLLDCDDLLEIFDEQGHHLKISSIVAQHFRLQLLNDDEISNKICSTCWMEIENFHAFYIDVQQAQKRLNAELAKNYDPDPDTEETEEDPDDSTDACETDDEKDFQDIPILPNCDVNFIEFMTKDRSNVSGDIDVFAAPSRTGCNEIKGRQLWKPSRKKSRNIIVADIDTPKDCTEDENFAAFYSTDFGTCSNKETQNQLIQKSFKGLGIPGLNKILQRKELSITAMPKISNNTTSNENEQEISKYIKLNCELCGTQFNIFSDLKSHFRTVHNIGGYVVCCNEKLFNRVHLVDHVMKHLDRSRFTKNTHFDNVCVKKCPHCRKVFKSKRHLDQHMKEHKVTGKKSSRAHCQQCGLWFKNRNTLYKHIRLHVDHNNDHVCTLCGKKSLSDIALHRHVHNVHYKERKYQCNMCDKAFKWSINLKEHMAIHTGESLYSCSYCSKTFNASSNLHSHRKKVHREEWEEERKKRIEMAINEKLSIELD